MIIDMKKLVKQLNEIDIKEAHISDTKINLDAALNTLANLMAQDVIDILKSNKVSSKRMVSYVVNIQAKELKRRIIDLLKEN